MSLDAMTLWRVRAAVELQSRSHAARLRWMYVCFLIWTQFGSLGSTSTISLEEYCSLYCGGRLVICRDENNSPLMAFGSWFHSINSCSVVCTSRYGFLSFIASTEHVCVMFVRNRRIFLSRAEGTKMATVKESDAYLETFRSPWVSWFLRATGMGWLFWI